MFYTCIKLSKNKWNFFNHKNRQGTYCEEEGYWQDWGRYERVVVDEYDQIYSIYLWNCQRIKFWKFRKSSSIHRKWVWVGMIKVWSSWLQYAVKEIFPPRWIVVHLIIADKSQDSKTLCVVLHIRHTPSEAHSSTLVKDKGKELYGFLDCLPSRSFQGELGNDQHKTPSPSFSEHKTKQNFYRAADLHCWKHHIVIPGCAHLGAEG